MNLNEFKQTAIRCSLLERIKVLDVELEQAKADRNKEGMKQRGIYLPQLTQRDAALKLAGETIRDSHWIKRSDNAPGWFHISKDDHDRALAAIKACGVEL